MAKQETAPCPSCSGRGQWTEKETRTGSVWDSRLKQMVPRTMEVTIDRRCSGPCGGSGVVYR